MTQELTSLQLGDSHFYFLSDPMAIRMNEYDKMNDHQRQDICTAFDDFGEGVNEKLITTINNSPNHTFFYGRRRFWGAQQSKFKTGKETVRLVDEVRKMFNPIKNFCEIHQTKDSAYILIPPEEMENPEVIHFISYIQITR